MLLRTSLPQRNVTPILCDCSLSHGGSTVASRSTLNSGPVVHLILLYSIEYSSHDENDRESEKIGEAEKTKQHRGTGNEILTSQSELRRTHLSMSDIPLRLKRSVPLRGETRMRSGSRPFVPWSERPTPMWRANPLLRSESDFVLRPPAREFPNANKRVESETP